MKDPMAGCLMLLLVIVIVGGFIWLAMWMSKKRSQELQAIAKELKLQFFPKGDERIAPLLVNLEFFHYGSKCKVTNLMHGKIARGRKSVIVAIFDYQYMMGAGEDAEVFIQTVMVFHDENIHVPAFNVRPENVMDKIGNFGGFQDINFTDFPVFSKRYRLDSNRVEDVRDLFQPSLLKFYEGHKICTEANGSTVVIYPFGSSTSSQSVRMEQGKTFTKSSFMSPNEIKAYLDLGLRLLSLLERNLVGKSTI